MPNALLLRDGAVMPTRKLLGGDAGLLFWWGLGNDERFGRAGGDAGGLGKCRARVTQISLVRSLRRSET